MPGYRSHILGGLAAAGALGVGLAWGDMFRPGPGEAAGLAVAGVLGGLFPDVDTDSKGQNLFYPVLIAVDLVLMALGEFRWAAVLGFLAMLPAVGRHRGWTHSGWAMLGVPLAVASLPVVFYGTPPTAVFPFFLAGTAGYASHLILDKIF
ncbi:MAG: hypothetical protein EOM25_08855 [Deltaproteobacteria bacterium]|nr:hypothetical protein [Deltaproteobacteria bacterium]